MKITEEYGWHGTSMLRMLSHYNNYNKGGYVKERYNQLNCIPFYKMYDA